MIKKSYIGKLFLLCVILFTLLPPFVLGVTWGLKSNKNLLYVAQGEEMIEIWNTSSGSLVERISEEISLWGFETDGTNFYLGGKDGKLYIYNSETKVWKEINISSLPIHALVLDPDSKILYIGSADNTLLAWNVEEEDKVKIVGEYDSYVMELAMDKHYIYSASIRGVIKIWDKQTMELIDTIGVVHEKDALWVMIVEGNRTYTGYASGKIEIWDLNTGLLINEVQAHQGEMRGLTSDGEYIYSSSINYQDKNVRIWTLNGEKVEPIINIEEYTPFRLAVDSNYLYVGTRERGVLVYNKSTWNLTMKLGEFVPFEVSSIKERTEITKGINPVLPVFIVFAIFFVIIVLFNIYSNVKKKHGKLTIKNIGKVLYSYVNIRDILNLLGVASIIILVLGLLNPKMVFSSFIPGLKLIYYFDALVKRGGFLPVWFLLLPSLGYWIAKKYKKKKKTRYLASIIGLVIAIIVFVLAPEII